MSRVEDRADDLSMAEKVGYRPPKVTVPAAERAGGAGPGEQVAFPRTEGEIICYLMEGMIEEADDERDGYRFKPGYGLLDIDADSGFGAGAAQVLSTLAAVAVADRSTAEEAELAEQLEELIERGRRLIRDRA